MNAKDNHAHNEAQRDQSQPDEHGVRHADSQLPRRRCRLRTAPPVPPTVYRTVRPSTTPPTTGTLAARPGLYPSTGRCRARAAGTTLSGRCDPTGYLKHCQVCARSEEHTSELQSLMRISYAVFCLENKKN